MSPKKNPARILIFGSCVSRDILNFAQDQQFEIVDYYARSSLASLGTMPVSMQEEALTKINSSFQRRMVLRDIRKSFLDDLENQEFDVLLLDLIDERFDLWEIHPGSVVTVSSEFFASGLVTSAQRTSTKWIASGSEQHRALWLTGVEKLVATLNVRGILKRVVINKVFWANQFEDGSPLPPPFSAAIIDKANHHLAWMYDQLERFVTPDNWMGFATEGFKANPQHRWGVSPFHYSNDYYQKARAALQNLVQSNLSMPSMRVQPDKTEEKIMNTDVNSYQIKQVLLACEENELVANVVSSGPSDAQFAFYVFRNEERIHAQWYTTSAVLRFDTKGTPGLYRIFAFLSASNGQSKTKYSNPVFLHPTMFTLSSPKKPKPERTALQLKGPHWTFSALYFNSENQRLFVMLSGATDRNKITLPYFNRWTWAGAGKFPGHVLCISDPTLELHDDMKVGWYFGTAKHDVTGELCSLIRRFAETLGIPEDKIVFWGSSGGGFAALAMASRIEGSTAVAVNAQTDVLAYHVDSAVNEVRNLCFNSKSAADIQQRFGHRVRMEKAWKNNRHSRAILVQNKVDTHHYHHHFQPFWAAFQGDAEGGRSADGRHFALLYDDPRGHGPEPEEMIPEILGCLEDHEHMELPLALDTAP